MSSLFNFPNRVNEKAARLVAGGVVIMTIFVLVFSWMWVLVLLSYGFIARVLWGPRFSPLALFVTKLVIPKLGWKAKMVPGPPKRFAQGIGAVMTTTALVIWLISDAVLAAKIITALILAAASFESILGFCLGCTIFKGLIKIGWIPESVCEDCGIHHLH